MEKTPQTKRPYEAPKLSTVAVFQPILAGTTPPPGFRRPPPPFR
jgi:hypothetical protein